MTVILCVGLLTTIRISGTAALSGWAVSDAGLAPGTTALELVGAPGDLDLVSAPGVAVLGVWELGAGLGARRKSEHRSQSTNA